MDQLQPVKSSGRLDLPYQEDACLSASQKMKQQQNLFQG